MKKSLVKEQQEYIYELLGKLEKANQQIKELKEQNCLLQNSNDFLKGYLKSQREVVAG
jgi:hypothetical protein